MRMCPGPVRIKTILGLKIVFLLVLMPFSFSTGVCNERFPLVDGAFCLVIVHYDRPSAHLMQSSIFYVLVLALIIIFYLSFVSLTPLLPTEYEVI